MFETNGSKHVKFLAMSILVTNSASVICIYIILHGWHIQIIKLINTTVNLKNQEKQEENNTLLLYNH